MTLRTDAAAATRRCIRSTAKAGFHDPALLFSHPPMSLQNFLHYDNLLPLRSLRAPAVYIRIDRINDAA
ncbi:MAG TPA: hypothetical protein VL921_10885 [Candidatus Udaeobacter sp.]|nr:hypothetical protein [Candidatus Udaeobacter sp.]